MVDADGNEYIRPDIAQLLDAACSTGKPRTQLAHTKKIKKKGKNTLVNSGESYTDSQAQCEPSHVYSAFQNNGKDTSYLLTYLTKGGHVSLPGTSCSGNGLSKDVDGIKCLACTITAVYPFHGKQADFDFNDPEYIEKTEEAKAKVIRSLPQAVREQLDPSKIVTLVTFPKDTDPAKQDIEYILYEHNQAQTYEWKDKHPVTQLGIMSKADTAKVATGGMTVSAAEKLMERVRVRAARLKNVIDNDLGRDKLWSSENWRRAEQDLGRRRKGLLIGSKQSKAFKDAASMVMSARSSKFSLTTNSASRNTLSRTTSQSTSPVDATSASSRESHNSQDPESPKRKRNDNDDASQTPDHEPKRRRGDRLPLAPTSGTEHSKAVPPYHGDRDGNDQNAQGMRHRSRINNAKKPHKQIGRRRK